MIESDSPPAPAAISSNDDPARRLRHELRTPLNQIIGYSEMLGEEAEEKGLDRWVDDLKKIELAGRKLLTMIDQLTQPQASTSERSASALTPPPGAGSTTLVSMPLPPMPVNARPELTLPPMGDAFVPAGSAAGWILVVDDNEANRDLLARRLVQRGYDVQTAADGAEALSLVETVGFDLVLLDVMMPGLSGTEVLRLLRERYSMADLPVIMATALDASADVVEALKLGANDYVTKPLDLSVVLARVGAQLSLKQARDEIHQLNRQLSEAQERIARLVDSSSEALHDVTRWSKAMAAEVAQAIGSSGIEVWINDHGALLEVTGGGNMPSVSLEQLREAARCSASIVRFNEVIVPVAGLMGEAFGALVVQGESGGWGEAGQRLLNSFARHLGGALELRRMRQELASAAEQRHATRDDMLARGVDVLQLCPTCGRCYGQGVERCEDDNAELESPRTFPYRVADRYRLMRLVGEGGMGTVFEALDERLGREVAVKVIKAEHFNNSTIRIRFENEARAVAKIDHPGVIAVYDSGELEDASLFIVMEWLRGVELAAMIKRWGKGTPTQVAELLRQGSAALGAAHRVGLIHRDIKPENIFLVPSGDCFRLKLLDFGVAKEMSDETRLTQTGSLIGTPLFMSPEQILGKKLDARSDVYSFAAVAYEALVGRRVTLEQEFVRVLFDVVKTDPPPISFFLPSAPPQVDHAFKWALSKSPSERPETVELWVDSFVDLLDSMKSDGTGWLHPDGSLRMEPGPKGSGTTLGTEVTRLDALGNIVGLRRRD